MFALLLGGTIKKDRGFKRTARFMDHPLHSEKTVAQLARPPVFEPAGKQDWNLLSKSLYSKGLSASV